MKARKIAENALEAQLRRKKEGRKDVKLRHVPRRDESVKPRRFVLRGHAPLRSWLLRGGKGAEISFALNRRVQ
jgi:hypothetical protein